MLERDCSKEDLYCETERKQLGGELDGDAIIELREEEECERQGEGLIT